MPAVSLVCRFFTVTSQDIDGIEVEPAQGGVYRCPQGVADAAERAQESPYFIIPFKYLFIISGHDKADGQHQGSDDEQR